MSATVKRSALGAMALASGLVALILTGAIAGFFYAYSSSVMRGLDSVDPRIAIVAMQGINETVRNVFFAPSFFGAPATCLLAAMLFLISRQRKPALAFAMAGLVYLLGALVLTFQINVPMNEALAAVTLPEDPDKSRLIWADYTSRWTFWNHVRMVFSFVALLLTGLGLYRAA